MSETCTSESSAATAVGSINKSDNYVSYLVQYNANPSCLVQAIVQRVDISWPLDNLKVGKKVLIRDGQTHCLGVILYINNPTECTIELEKVSKRCQQHVKSLKHLVRFQKNQQLEAKTWLLVYYSCGTSRSAYSIVSINDIIWRGKNYSTTFINAGDGRLYEACIWCLSKKRAQIEIALGEVRGIHEATVRTTRKACEVQPRLPAIEDEGKTVQEENCLNYYYHYIKLNEKLNLLKSLDRLEQKLKHDTASIEDTTQAITRSCRKLDELLNKLSADEKNS